MAGFSVPLAQVLYQGVPASNARITVYRSGTTIPVAVFSDGALSSPIANPIVCDSNGEAAFYVGAEYSLRLLIRTSGGTLIRDIDPVYPVPVLTGFTGGGSDLNALVGVTPGAAAAGKALVLNADKELTDLKRLGTEEGYYSPYSGLKNLVIGGDFGTNPWQRGTSFAGVANGAYTADRFAYIKNGGVVHAISKDADAPPVGQPAGAFNNPRFTSHSLRLNLTTPQAGVAAGDFCAIAHRIEGFNFMSIAQKPFTLSFWVKATNPGTYCVAFRNGAPDRTFVATYAVTTPNTWEFKTVSVAASPAGGTWNYTNGIGLEVLWVLSSGTSGQIPTLNAWQAGGGIAPSGYGNFVSAGNTDFRLALIQIEPGPVDTMFENRSFQQELALSMRYYQKSFPVTVAPAQNAGFPGASSFISQAAATFGGSVVFPVRFRAMPSITTFNPAAANANWRDITNSTDRTVAVTNIGETSFGLNGTGGAANSENRIHYTAEAEL